MGVYNKIQLSVSAFLAIIYHNVREILGPWGSSHVVNNCVVQSEGRCWENHVSLCAVNKVLAVDMDPQGNLSFAMGADTESATIYDVLKGELKPRYAVQKSALVDIIPSNILLSGIELEFTGARREFLLKEALESLKSSYDYILIDSPPALGVLTVNAFTASDYVLVPMLSDIFSLQGITQLDETICRVRNYCNPRIQILGVFLTKHNPRTNFSKEVEGALRMVAEDLDVPVLDTFIRDSVALREAQSLQRSVLEYAPECNAVQDYKKLIQELIQRGLKADV